MHRDVERTREIAAARLSAPGVCYRPTAMPALTSERKREIAAKFGAERARHGQHRVQVALLTERINHLTEHLRDARRTTTPAAGC